MNTKVLALAVTSHLSVNGLILPTLDGLRSAGWRVHIVCSPGPIEPEVRRLASVDFVPMERSISPVRDSAAVVRMARLLRRTRPTILVGSTPKGAMIAMAAGRLARVPVRVFHVWGARWDGAEGRLRRVLIAADRMTSMNATDVLSVSDSLADLMVEHGACRERPVVLGSGGSKGVDTSIFYPADDYRFDPATPRIGFVGRLSVDKGIEDVLGLFKAAKSVVPEVSLTVVGEQDDAQPVPPKTLDSLKHDPSIHWIPKLSAEEVAEAMREMDVLAFPSVREGLPNVVIEAAACGVPTVGWEVTGVRDAVVHGETGYLAPWGDVASFAEGLLRAIDPIRHENLRRSAIRFANAEFSSDKVQSDFVEYLDALVSGLAGHE